MQKIGIVLLAFFCSPLQAKTYSEIPADGRQFLNSLPSKAITLDFVTRTAILSADSFRAIRAQMPLISVSELTSLAPLDFNLDASYSFYHSRNEPDSPFGLNRMENLQWNLGFSKYFSTGTNFGFSLIQGRYIKTLPQAFQGLGYDDLYKTTAEVSISQNLWRDAFGFATRKNLLKGQLEAEVKKLEIDEAAEDWFSGLTQVFYGAWGAQSDVRAAMAGLQRRERLLSITQKKVSNGTAEKPDLLQVKSAVSGSKIRLMAAREALDSVWRNLVTTLKFPAAWGTIDPLQIPVEIDNLADAALGFCKQNSQIPPTANINTNYRKALLQRDAANNAFDAAKNLTSPQLALNLIGGGNGVDARDSSQATNESINFEHPHYSAMLMFKMPLNNYQAEASLRQAMAAKEIANARLSQVKGNFESDWLIACDQLSNWQLRVSELKQVVENQKERVALEENRFRYGRVPLLNVIQSGDEQTDAEINYNNAQIQYRHSAWKVKRLNGLTKTYLSEKAQKVP